MDALMDKELGRQIALIRLRKIRNLKQKKGENEKKIRRYL